MSRNIFTETVTVRFTIIIIFLGIAIQSGAFESLCLEENDKVANLQSFLSNMLNIFILTVHTDPNLEDRKKIWVTLKSNSVYFN